MAGAYFGYTLLRGINLASRRTPLSTLRGDRALLESGVPLSGEELRRIEQNLLGTDVPIGQGFLALPFLVGTPIALAPAFDRSSSEGEKTRSLIFGGLLGVTGLFVAITPDIVNSYKRNLDASGLILTAGPASIEALYLF